MRPPLIVEEPELPPAPLPPLNPIERNQFDYNELEATIAYAQQVTRQTRRALDTLIRAVRVRLCRRRAFADSQPRCTRQVCEIRARIILTWRDVV